MGLGPAHRASLSQGGESLIRARALAHAARELVRQGTSEALLATWSEFDLDTGVWTVPKDRMKSRQEHIVPLSPKAIEILAGQRRLNTAYVFPSPTLSGRPMSNMALLAVLDRLGVRRDTTVHGLCRATFYMGERDRRWAPRCSRSLPGAKCGATCKREIDP
jgi:integrase